MSSAIILLTIVLILILENIQTEFEPYNLLVLTVIIARMSVSNNVRTNNTGRSVLEAYSVISYVSRGSCCTVAEAMGTHA